MNANVTKIIPKNKGSRNQTLVKNPTAIVATKIRLPTSAVHGLELRGEKVKIYMRV